MYGISEYRSAYLRGLFSPDQVIADHLRYAKIVQERVNAISVINPNAERLAEESAQRYRQERPLGPLDGIPVIVKDSYHVRGLPRWHGSAIHEGDAVSAFSSEPILRLEEQGAIVLCKGTMPDMGMLGSGISSQFGIVRNPWNPMFSPGGSSSGPGAALACGLGAMALGTDVAGSVRLPAAHCGLAGIKPTQGRIAYSPASTMRSSGVLGRSVSDVIEGLACVGRQASTDPWCLPGRFEPQPIEQVLATMPRVGLILNMGYGKPVVADVEQSVRRAAIRLEQAGCRVEELALHLTDTDFANADRVFKAHAASEIRSSRHPDKVLDLVHDWVQEAERVSMADYDDALNGLLITVHAIQEATCRYDYLICPVIPVIGFPAESPGPGDDAMLLHHTQFTAWFNQTCQPAATYCEGFSKPDRMPIGVQIVGRRFDDSGVLALTQLLEQTRQGSVDYPVFEEVPDYGW